MENEFILSNGVKIPCIGFGPGVPEYYTNFNYFSNKYLHFIERAYNKIIRRPIAYRKFSNEIANAVQLGFHLIDYSSSYGDGKLIKDAIQRSGVNREKIFLTTRISNQAQVNGKIKECLIKQLKGMGVEYIDLLMFHWPVTDYYINTWLEMVKLYKEGYCKALGVANCHQHHLEQLFKVSDVVPHINQFEVHPLLTQKPLINYCKQHNIQVEGYTPIARMDDRLVRLPILKKIASKYNKSIAQIILRWHIQNGVIPIVRSHNRIRQKENISIFDFTLTNEELKIIDSININSRLRYDPDNCDFNIL